MEEYNDLIIQMKNLKEELLMIKKYIDWINSFYKIIRENRSKAKQIVYLRSQLSIGLFNKEKRKEIKKAIIDISNEIVNIDSKEEIRNIKRDFEENFVSKYPEYRNINDLFKTVDINDMLNILNDIYEKKAHIYNSKIDKYFEVQRNLYNNHVKILK